MKKRRFIIGLIQCFFSFIMGIGAYTLIIDGSAVKFVLGVGGAILGVSYWISGTNKINSTI